MSVLPTSGVVVSAAGLPLAQAGGPDAIRSQQAATVQQRQLNSELRAADTAGIAKTDGEDQQANDRDADGRLAWQVTVLPEQTAEEMPLDEVPPDGAESHLPKDPRGESGSQLDLTG